MAEEIKTRMTQRLRLNNPKVPSLSVLVNLLPINLEVSELVCIFAEAYESSAILS